MIKLLFVFLNLFNNLIYKDNEIKSFNENSEYEDFIYVEDIQESKVKKKIGEVILYETTDGYTISIKNKRTIIKGDKVTFEVVGDLVYVFSYDDDMKHTNILNFDIFGNLLSKDIFHIEEVYGPIISHSYNDYVYVMFTTIDANNLKYIAEYTFGARDERNSISKNQDIILLDYEVDDNYFYVLYQKDSLSNTFCYDVILDKLEYDMEEVDFIMLKQDVHNHFDLKILNGFLYLVCNDILYKFDYNLKLINSIELNDYSFVYFGLNELIIIVKSNNITIVDSSLTKIKELEIDNTKKKYYDCHDYIGYTNEDNSYLFDIIDLRKSSIPSIYLKKYDSIYVDAVCDVYSLFGKCDLLTKLDLSKNQFKLKDNIDIVYKTKSGLTCNRRIQKRMLLETNVSNNMVYPVGYRILFNCNATLDNEKIISNKQVLETGKHTLKLFDESFEAFIDFYICESNVDIANDTLVHLPEELNRIALEATLNTPFTIQYQLGINSSDVVATDISISNINTIGCEVLKYEIKDVSGIYNLFITFEGFAKPKTNYFFFKDFIISIDKSYEQLITVNEIYIVNVSTKVIEFNNYYTDKSYNYYLEYVDPLKQAKMLKLTLDNSNTNYEFYYSLDQNNIVIDNIIEGKYLAVFSIVYDIYDYEYLETDLLTLVLEYNGESVEIGSLYLFNEGINNSKLKIEINESLKKNMLYELSIVDIDNSKIDKVKLVKVFDKSIETNNIFYYVIFIIISSIIAIITCYVVKKIKNKNNILNEYDL